MPEIKTPLLREAAEYATKCYRDAGFTDNQIPLIMENGVQYIDDWYKPEIREKLPYHVGSDLWHVSGVIRGASDAYRGMKIAGIQLTAHDWLTLILAAAWHDSGYVREAGEIPEIIPDDQIYRDHQNRSALQFAVHCYKFGVPEQIIGRVQNCILQTRQILKAKPSCLREATSDDLKRLEQLQFALCG